MRQVCFPTMMRWRFLSADALLGRGLQNARSICQKIVEGLVADIACTQSPLDC